MAYFQFATDLFLEVQELTRFKEFLDDDGFRKNILDNSVSFGLVKSLQDPTFANGRVQQDVANSLGQQTIKIGAINAIDSNGLFIINPTTNALPVPADSNWYWIKISHQYLSVELGTVTIDATGNMTGVGTEFTQVLRGNPNFPSRIRFINSTGNNLEYDVLAVTDDTHAVIVHPAVSIGGNAVFTAETGLGYKVVGTFTPGVAVPNENKYPFRYDACDLEVVLEVNPNVRPAYVIGQEFFLARVKVSSGVLVIQDKRTDFWETKGSDLSIDINRNDAITVPTNPLIGVENVKWQNSFNTGDRNIVQIAWGMRSTNWSVDSSKNILSMFGSSIGGVFKTIDSFTDGDFDGWRLYFTNGKYAIVISSVKQGTAINLSLDILDVDNLSNDGGLTFNTTDEVFVCPDCEEVEIKITENPIDGIVNANETLIFPVNTHLADCLATVYKDPSCLVNVLYRYKSFKEFTPWVPFSNEGSYLTEVSFDATGNLVASADRVAFDYTPDNVAGYIQLQLSPNSFIKFSQRVYKGDVIGVNDINTFSPGAVIQFQVGVDKRYQYISGNIALSDDIFLSLSRTGAVDGNEFRFHFNCDALTLGTNHINIVDNYAGGSVVSVKVISQGDAYVMMNQDGGIVIDCVFDGTAWHAYQNYELGISGEITMFDGDLTANFDATSGAGKTKGFFGWSVYNIMQGRTPLGQGVLTDAEGNTLTFGIGATGGVFKHTQSLDELPEHRFNMFNPGAGGVAGNIGADQFATPNAGLGGNSSYNIQNNPDQVTEPTLGQTSKVGKGLPITVTQPYYAVAFIKKQF